MHLHLGPRFYNEQEYSSGSLSKKSQVNGIDGRKQGPLMNCLAGPGGRGLTKSYGDVQALRGVNLEVRRGEVFGLPGHQRLGQARHQSLMLDLIRPDGGACACGAGFPSGRRPLAVRARLGYCRASCAWTNNRTAEATCALKPPAPGEGRLGFVALDARARAST